MEGIDPKLRGKLNKMYFKTTTSGDHAWASSENTGISTTNPVQVKALKKALVIPMSLFLLKFLKGKKNGKRVVARGRKVGGAAKLSRQMWRLILMKKIMVVMFMKVEKWRDWEMILLQV